MEILKKEIYDIINSMIPASSTIGLHGVKIAKNKDSIESNLNRVFNIIENGLDVKSSKHASIHGTVMMIGHTDNDEERIIERIDSYEWDDSQNFIVVSIPEEIVCEDGRTLYIGIPDEKIHRKIEFDVESSGEEYDSAGNTCMADAIFQSNIPTEFIVGNYRVINNEKVNLTLNEDFIGLKNGKLSTKTFNELEARYNNYINSIDESNSFVAKRTNELKSKYKRKNKVIKVTDRIWDILAEPDSIEQYKNDTTFKLSDLLEITKKNVSKMLSGNKGKKK